MKIIERLFLKKTRDKKIQKDCLKYKFLPEIKDIISYKIRYKSLRKRK